MPLPFLLDEQLRGVLARAIQRHNAQGGDPIDALCVGDPPDLPLGSKDPDILLWAEREGRLHVTRDRRTMVSYFMRHLQAGRHCPGLLLLRAGWRVHAVIGALEAVAVPTSSWTTSCTSPEPLRRPPP